MIEISPRTREKYRLYERSVQSPEYHIQWFVDVYRELRKKYARRLREDFCGTFRLSAEWVKRNRNNEALGLDLDPEPLEYGRQTHLAPLTPSQKKRLKVLRKNVISTTKPASDIVIACNFSFCTFRDRPTLVKYFKAVRKSLRPDGLFILDLAGGPGMIEEMRERKVLRTKGKTLATYIWDQQSFDPIHREGHWAIHFRFPGGRRMEEAFHYHWRLWTIPEVRDALIEAGFADSTVYWETEHDGEGTGEYVRSEKGDNAYAWVTYIVGSPKKLPPLPSAK